MVTLVAVKMKRLAREVYINGTVLQTNYMRQLERQLLSLSYNQDPADSNH